MGDDASGGEAEETERIRRTNWYGDAEREPTFLLSSPLVLLLLTSFHHSITFLFLFLRVVFCEQPHFLGTVALLAMS